MKCNSGVDNSNKTSIDGQKDIEDNENIRPAAYAVKQVKCIPKSSSSATVAAIIDRYKINSYHSIIFIGNNKHSG